MIHYLRDRFQNYKNEGTLFLYEKINFGMHMKGDLPNKAGVDGTVPGSANNTMYASVIVPDCYNVLAQKLRS